MSHQCFLALLHFLVAFQTLTYLVNGESLAFQCEVSRFSVGALFQREGIAMKGHVRKSTKAPSLLQCGQLCLAHLEWCISVNFEFKAVDDQNSAQVCELNNRGVKSESEFFGSEFEPRIGFMYSQIRPKEVRDFVLHVQKVLSQVEIIFLK